MARKSSNAEKRWRSVRSFIQPYTLLMAQVEERKFDEAISSATALEVLFPHDAGALLYLARTYALSGKQREAIELLREIERQYKEPDVSPYELAYIYLAPGRSDRALDLLEKNYTERGLRMTFLKVDPAWDPPRSQARFKELLRRMNFPE